MMAQIPSVQADGPGPSGVSRGPQLLATRGARPPSLRVAPCLIGRCVVRVRDDGAGRRPVVTEARTGPVERGTPVTYADLVALAENLRWTWHMDARALFQGLFNEATPVELEWPLRLLREIGPEEIETRLGAQPALAALARAVVDDRSDYLVPDDPRRRPGHGGRLPRRRVRAHRLAADLRRGARRHRGRAAEELERPRGAPGRRRAALPRDVAAAARRARRAARELGGARPGHAPGFARARRGRRAPHN